MSVICQTFVQNTWRKDLCSNCFKSKEEHGAGGGGGGGGGLFGGSNTPGGDIRGGGGGGGISQRDGSVGEDRGDRPQHYTSIGKNGMDGGGFGVGGLGSSGTRGGSKRYVGVAERVYRRGYYPQNSWKSLVIDKNDSSHSERLSSTTSHTNTNTTSSCSALTSPALIRGMSTSLVSHENEKNLKLSDLGTSSDLLRCSRLVRQVRSSTDQLLLTPSPCTTQSQARILTQLLGEDRKDPHENEDRRGRREVEEDVRRSEDKEDFEKGDVSSDLGSEASHDSSNSQMSSPSSSSSSSSYHTSHSAPDSDTGSIKSDNNDDEDDDEDDLYREEQIEEEKKKRDEEAKRSSRVTLLRGSRVTRSSSPTSSPPPPPPPSTQPPLPHVSFPLFPASRSVSASSLYSPPTPLPTTTTTTTTTITSQSVVPSFSVTSSTPTSRSLSTSPTSTHITTTTSSSSSTSSSSLSSSLTSRSLTSSSSHSTPSSRSLTSSSSISTSASRSLTSSSTLTTPTPTSRSLPSTVFTSSPPTPAPTTTTPYSTPTQSPTSSPPVRTPATAPSSTPTNTSKPTPTTTSKPTPTNTTKPTPTYTSKPTPTSTSKPTPTTTSNPTLTNTSKPTPTTTTSNPTPTNSSYQTPTTISKPTPTNTTKPTPTNTSNPTPTTTSKPTPTYTSNPTPTTTSKPTPTYTSKPTPTYTTKPTPTNTAKPTPTNTAKPTPTNTAKPTPTNTAKPTPTNTAKPTPTNTAKPTPTNTAKPTLTNTSNPTLTNTSKPTHPTTTTSKPTPPSPTSHPAPPPPTTTTTTTTSTVPSSSVSAPPLSSSPISTTTTPSSPASATPSVTQPPAAGILKKAKEGNKRPGNKRNNNNNSPLRRGITFNPKLEKVIGFGGDVDYSDDEDDYDDDDDDDDDEDYDDPSDLTPDERVLRQLTMKNTDFNSDNDNLKKDIPEDELLPSVEELEAKRKIIIAEIEALERLGRERAKKEQEGDKTQQEKAPTEACKQEGKVKLKRSPPLVTTKPLIARSSSTEPRVNQVLPMKNGEVVRPGGVQVEAGGGNGGKVGGGLLENEVAVEEAQEEEEEVPLKGIKPKYVSREEEMVEKEVQEDEVKLLHKPVGRVKVTAIDDVCKEKVTVIDEVVCTKQVNDVSTKKTRSSGVGDVLCTKRMTLNDDDVSGKRETPIMTDSSMKKGTSADDSSTKNVTSTSDSKRVGPKHDVSKAMSAKSDKDQDNAISTHKQTLSDNTITSKKPDSQTSKSTNSGASDKPQQQTRPSSDPRLQTNSLTPSSKSNKSEARQPSSSGGSKPSSISATPRTSLANDTSKPQQQQQQQQQKSENAAATLVRGDDNTKPGLLNERDTTSASFTTTPITTNTTTSSSSYRKQGSESVGVSEGDTCSSAVNPNTSPTIVSSSSTTTTHPRKSEAKASVISEGTSGKEVNRQVAQDSTTTPKCKTASSIAKTVTTTLSTTTTTTTKGTVNAVTKKTVVTGKSLSAPPPTTVQNSTTSTTTTKSQSSSSDPRRRLSNLALTHDSVVSVSQAESSPKTPASRQGSNSSLMSTFGTPVIITTSQSSTSAASSPSSSSSSSSFQQNSSFLHSSPARGMYDDVYSCPSNVMIPSTPDFLREIRAPAEVQSPTAGIQKSGLYASTSCLKGIPGSKPVITPKPPTLKDKPKLPMKPPPSSSRIIYATPAPVNPKVPIGSFSMSSPNLAGMGGEMKEDLASSTSSLTSSSSTGRSEAGKQLPPPTTQAPAVPRSEVNGSSRCKEAVYDVPVTLSSSALSSSSSHASPSLSSTSSRTSITTTSSSPKSPSTTSSSTDTNKKVDDVTIYHEIDDSIKSTTTTATLSTITSAVTRHESTRCQPRSTFEANRSMLSAALDMRAARSSPGKRLAPIPPEEENEEQAGEVPSEDQPKQIASPAVEGQQQQQQQQGLSTLHLASMTPSQDSQGTDGGSYSSFTDDFDDDDDEEDEVMGARSQEDVATMRKSERSISAAPLYRNSIGPILSHHEIEGTHFATPSPTITNNNNNTTNTIQSPVPALPPPAVVVMCPTGDSVSSRHSPATRSHSVPRTNEYLVSLSGDGGRGLPGLGGSSSSAASSSSSSSKFSFGRSGFFRPSSPPSVKRGSSTSSERGRDRKAKKTPSSSSSSSSSSSKFSLKKLLRLGGGGKEEERRKKEGGRGKEEEKRLARETRKGKLTIIHPLDYNQNGVEVIARPEKTSPIYDYTGIYGYVPPPRPIPDSFSPCPTPQPTSGLVQASPAPSQASRGSSEASSKEGVKVRNGGEKSTDENGYATPSVQPSTVYASSTTGIPGVSVPSTCTPNTAPSSAGSGSSNGGAGVEKRNSFLRKDSTCVERRESAASQSSRSSGSNSTQHHLGYNSEGRPRPPPPPRKASLENTQGGDTANPSPTDPTFTRPPQRPPPPTRTPSTAGTRSGPPRPDPPRPEPPRLIRDSVYANLGDVRAPITPRKPGRTSSIRGEDDREKRRAPQPPAAFQQSGQEEEEEEVGIHYKANKGPAPNTPSYQLQEDVQSSRAVRRVSSGVRRSAPSAPLAPRSLRDQYGAVISANMDALANFLDQLSTTPHQPEFEKLNHWNEIRTEEQAVAEAGQRVFYVGSTRGRCVTIMVTPEPKVDTHHLLGPLPLANFKDELPRHLLYQGCVTRGKTIPGTVWVLPALDLVSLEQLSVEVTGAPTTAPWLVLLQLVTGLKQLQARGVEETHLNLTLVARGSEGEGYDPHPTLIIVPPSDSDGDVMSLCQCAAAATNILLHGVDGEANREDPSSLPPPAPLLLHLLHQERSGSLTQVKRVLEVLLFGPDNWPGEDVDDHDSDPEDSQAAEEAALERWLDLERAKLLHTLTRGPPASRVLAKFHLLFLIRANPRALRETLALLGQPEVTEF